MSVTTTVVGAAIVVLVYAYLCERISAFMQPTRLELLDRAAKLLQYRDLREVDKHAINEVLDRAYSYRAAWYLAIWIFPMSVRSGVRRLRHHHRSLAHAHFPHKGEIVDFARLALPAILLNSPLALVVFTIGALLATLAMLPVRSAMFLALFMSNNDKNGDSSFDGRVC